MKKKNVTKKIVLKKEIIAALTQEKMDNLRAGAGPSDLGVSCFTGHCCKSVEIEC